MEGAQIPEHCGLFPGVRPALHILAKRNGRSGRTQLDLLAVVY